MRGTLAAFILPVVVVAGFPALAWGQTPTPTVSPSPAATAAPEPSPAAAPTPEPLAADEESLYWAGSTDPRAPKLRGWIIATYDNDDGKGAGRLSQSTYAVQNARFELVGSVSPAVAYFISAEATRGPKFLNDAYITIDAGKRLPKRFKAKVIAGQFKKPIGYENSLDEKDLIPPDRSNLNPLLASGDARDIGLMLDVAAGALETQFTVINGSGPFDGQFSSEDDNHKDVITRVGGHVKAGDRFDARAGVTVLGGKRQEEILSPVPTAPQVDYYWRGAYDAQVTAGDLVVITEGAYGTGTIPAPDTATPSRTVTSSGAYLLVGYKLRGGAVLPWSRYEYREISSGGASDDGLPKDWSNRTTVGANWQFVPGKAMLRTALHATSGVEDGPLGVIYSRKLSLGATAGLQVSFP